MVQINVARVRNLQNVIFHIESEMFHAALSDLNIWHCSTKLWVSFQSIMSLSAFDN